MDVHVDLSAACKYSFERVLALSTLKRVCLRKVDCDDGHVDEPRKLNGHACKLCIIRTFVVIM